MFDSYYRLQSVAFSESPPPRYSYLEEASYGVVPHNNNQTPCLARLSTIRRPKFSRKPLGLLALKKAALVATTIVLVKDLYDTVDALRQAGLL